MQRHRRIAQEIYAEPKSVGGHIRQGLLTLWVRHGAGFYGLGWVITFIVLEVQLITGELAESAGVADFVSSQLLEYLLRLGFMSFVNGLLASIWPLYVLQWLSGWGILVLVLGYYGFEKLLRPLVESSYPELREAREAAAAKKAAKAEHKERKKRKQKKRNNEQSDHTNEDKTQDSK